MTIAETGTDAVELSVVVPVHNVGPWIEQCLTSILDQDVASMEVIVVDDHSTDDTVERILAVAGDDPRLRLITAPPRRGGAHARNRGVDLAVGEFLVFADGDDLVPRGAYRRMVTALRESGDDMAVGDFLKFRSGATVSHTKRSKLFVRPRSHVTIVDLPALLRNRAIWHKMFRLRFWLDTGITFPQAARSNDIVPMTRAVTEARGITIVPHVVYLYRDRPGTQSMTRRATLLTGVLSYFEQELECARLVVATRHLHVIQEYFDVFLFADGWVHLRGYLQTHDVDADPDDLERLAAALRGLLALATRQQLDRLGDSARRSFLLMANGRLDLALRLPDFSGRAPVSDQPDRSDRIDRAALAGALDLSNEMYMRVPDDTEIIARIFLDQVARPLARALPTAADDEVVELGDFFRRLGRRHGRPIRQHTDWRSVEPLLRLGTKGRPAPLRVWGALVSSVRADVSVDGADLVIDSVRGPVGDGVDLSGTRLLFVHTITGAQVEGPVLDLPVGSARTTVALPDEVASGPGPWRLYLSARLGDDHVHHRLAREALPGERQNGGFVPTPVPTPVALPQAAGATPSTSPTPSPSAAGSGRSPGLDVVDGETALDETPPTELTALTPATPDEAWTIVVPPAAVRPVHEALARVRRRLGPRAGR